MSDFVAGFASRQTAAAVALHRAFDDAPRGFEASELAWRRSAAPVSFTAQPQNGQPQNGQPQNGHPENGPKHFSPADPDSNPTQGWDPFAAEDPLEAARAAGFAEGLAAGRAEAVPDTRNESLIAGLTQAFADGTRVDREQMARELRQTVMHLVTRLVGEIGIAPALLAQRIAAASDLLAGTAESALLRVHPDDVALLEGLLPASVFAAGDASVARGSFVLESASTIVEDGPEIWLEQLASAIDSIPVPAAC
jgi:flagellar assembly protein FliH